MRSRHLALIAMISVGCAATGPALVGHALTGSPEEDVAQLLAQVETLRAARTMESYEKALELCRLVASIDPSQQSLVEVVRWEYDEYLWTVHEKFAKDGDELQRMLSTRMRMYPLPVFRPPF